MRKGTNSLQFIHLLNKTKQALGGGKRKTSEMASAEGLGGGERIREALKVFN